MVAQQKGFASFLRFENWFLRPGAIKDLLQETKISEQHTVRCVCSLNFTVFDEKLSQTDQCRAHNQHHQHPRTHVHVHPACTTASLAGKFYIEILCIQKAQFIQKKVASISTINKGTKRNCRIYSPPFRQTWKTITYLQIATGTAEGCTMYAYHTKRFTSLLLSAVVRLISYRHE